MLPTIQAEQQPQLVAKDRNSETLDQRNLLRLTSLLLVESDGCISAAP